MNPFKYGRVVDKQDYCPRPALERQLRSRIQSGQNVYIEGERRTGKTSLIINTIASMKGKKHVYIDLLEVKTVQDIHKRVLHGILQSHRETGFITRMLTGLAALRPALGFDPMTGLPTISLDNSIDLPPDSLEGLLDLFLRRDFRNHAVVIDEFQDILNLPDARAVQAVMRGRIQFIQNVPFVFCGSVRSRINLIFNDPDSPFYKAALPTDVGPIERSGFSAFLTAKFKRAGMALSPAVLNRIFAITGENPGDTQQLCAALFDVSERGTGLSEDSVNEALVRVFSQEQKGYEAHMARITAVQLKCLCALARHGGKNILSRDFMTVSGIKNPTTIKKSFKRMENLKIVFNTESQYKFVNPFFGQWLVYRNF